MYNRGDDADRAESEIERSTAESIRMHSQQEKPPIDWDRETCYTCGVDLPIERIRAKRFRCVYHQELIEKRNKGY